MDFQKICYQLKSIDMVIPSMKVISLKLKCERLLALEFATLKVDSMKFCQMKAIQWLFESCSQFPNEFRQRSCFQRFIIKKIFCHRNFTKKKAIMICHQIKPHSRGNLSTKNVFVSYLWKKRVVFWFAIDEVSFHGPKMMKQTSTNSSLQKSIQLILNRWNSLPWVFFPIKTISTEF